MIFHLRLTNPHRPQQDSQPTSQCLNTTRAPRSNTLPARAHRQTVLCHLSPSEAWDDLLTRSPLLRSAGPLSMAALIVSTSAYPRAIHAFRPNPPSSTLTTDGFRSQKIPPSDRTSTTMPTTNLGHISRTCSRAWVMLHLRVVDTNSSRYTPMLAYGAAQHPRSFASTPKHHTAHHTHPFSLLSHRPAGSVFGLRPLRLCHFSRAFQRPSPLFLAPLGVLIEWLSSYRITKHPLY